MLFTRLRLGCLLPLAVLALGEGALPSSATRMAPRKPTPAEESALAPGYAFIVAGESAKPVLYLEFKAREMRVATTPEGLQTAAPVPPRDSYGLPSGRVHYYFPEIDIPLHVEGTASVKASFTAYLGPQSSPGRAAPGGGGGAPSLGADVRITRPDRRGTPWTYRVFIEAPLSSSRDGDGAGVLPLPDPSRIVLTVETDVTGRTVGIGLRPAMAGPREPGRGVGVDEILKNGKPAPASLEVTDKDGKVVHTKKGDLTKFGFT